MLAGEEPYCCDAGAELLPVNPVAELGGLGGLVSRLGSPLISRTHPKILWPEALADPIILRPASELAFWKATGGTDEANSLFRRADHRDFEGCGSSREHPGGLPREQYFGTDVFQYLAAVAKTQLLLPIHVVFPGSSLLKMKHEHQSGKEEQIPVVL